MRVHNPDPNSATCLADGQPWPCPKAGTIDPGPGCPWCGVPSAGICGRCHMTPGEHAYTARILADSDAVLREEYAAYRRSKAMAS